MITISSNYKKLTFAVLLVASVFVATFFIYSTSAAEPSPDQISAALTDLSQVTGQDITSKAQAQEVCDSEKFLTVCAEVGKRHNLYQPEEVKQVDSFLNEIKGQIAQDLQSCQNVECLVGVANNLAKKFTTADPKLAASLDLTPKLVASKQDIVTAAKESGVSFEQCSSMDPDTASIDLLRSCARLAKDSRVQAILPASVKQAAEYSDKILDLKESLVKGEFQCGDNTAEGCGNFCLKPTDRTQGIPQVCQEIAKKFFGPDGVAQLEQSYKQISQTKDFYQRKADNVVFTTIDGKTITNPADVGRYLEEQGRQGNVDAVSKGMDFLVSQGFVKPTERDFALKMVAKIKEQGGSFNFEQCNTNPESCRDFLPDDEKANFDSHLQVQQILTKEGLDPQECQKGQFDPAIAAKCLEGSKRALGQLETLANTSPELRGLIGNIRQNVSGRENQISRRDEFNQVFQQQGGPGGCKSEQDCHAYCSDPSHGPECISFGAKQGISGFRGQEAVQRFQQFNQELQAPEEAQRFNNFQGGFGSQGQGQGGFIFPGRGPFPGFQPPGQGGFPLGQQDGFPGQFGQPGFSNAGANQGGFFGGQNTGGFNQGPSPECFAAIQSGDFVRAKELCTVTIPVGQPNFTPIGPPVTPGPSFQPTGQPYCPPGFYWDAGLRQCRTNTDTGPQPSYSSGPYPTGPYSSSSPTGNLETDCKTYGGTWDAVNHYCKFPTPTYSPPPGGSYTPGPTPGSCSADQWWDYATRSCRPNGTASYSPNPSSGSCPPGQYWFYPSSGAGYCKTNEPYPSYSPGGSYTPYPSPQSCPSGQWWDYSTSSCRSTTSSGSCPSGAHTMYVNGAGGYCMSDADSSKCGPLNSSSVSGFTSCSTYQTAPSYSPSPGGSYTPYPSPGSCPSGQWWDYITKSCRSNTPTSSYPSYSPGGSYTPYPSPGTCPAGQYWFWPPSGAGYCKTNEPYPSYTSGGSYTPYPSPGSCPSGQWWDYSTSSCRANYSASTTPTYSAYPSYSTAPGTSYTPYPNSSAAPSYAPTYSYAPPPSYSAAPAPSYSYVPPPTTNATPYPTTQYVPPPTYSNPPPSSPPPPPPLPPTGFLNANGMALASAIMSCSDRYGRWDSSAGDCRSTPQSFVASVFRFVFGWKVKR